MRLFDNRIESEQGEMTRKGGIKSVEVRRYQKILSGLAEMGQFRTVRIDGELWFVGKDVAEALGYERPTDTVRKRVDDEDRGISKMETPSGKQEMTIINESGIYTLVLGSKLEKAWNSHLQNGSNGG